MKNIIKKIPILGPVAKRVYRFFYKPKPFKGSENYWVELYESGGNSGEGSYNELAEFKAKIINRFVKENDIKTIIEHGCGDGNQLKLAEYPSYTGFDISPHAVKLCKEIFTGDDTKRFKLASEYNGEKAQLVLSLDVIYHLVEDDVYIFYMERLFNSSEKFIIIYSSDFEQEHINHEKRRKFTSWIKDNQVDWKLIQHIPNEFPYNGNCEVSSLSDFYIFEKV